VPKLVEKLNGSLFADKGYLGQEFFEKVKRSIYGDFYKGQKEYEKKEY